ncbi:MAG: tetratricopeptide repeat protein [Treponema sp.]|jgi:Ca-activated chloride channel family protein|nr:tetratricopeptide repeat protein [Treponema sp.]
MEGNFFNSRGMYTEAIASYMKALEHTEVLPYAEFGLGSVYVSLDEGDVALERFGAAEAALRDMPQHTHPELVYRIHYNTGVVRFEKGDYAGATAAFRSALEADGSRIEAKRNLELSLLSLSRSNTEAASGAVQANQDRTEKAEAGATALFDYLRRKEQDQWKSREWIEDTPVSGPDY